MTQFKIAGFDQVITEYFDIAHHETRKILLAIDEADQNQILTNLTSKLYDNIVTKVDDIDFGTIPESKGDITKIENYDKLKECVQIIHDLLVEYKQDLAPIQTIEDAIRNVESRRELFEKGFRYNIEFIMVTYCSVTLAIVSSVSFMIASCIEFIKSPKEETFDVIIDRAAVKRTNQNLLFNNLSKFNKACNKNQIDSSLEFLTKNNVKNFTGVDIGVIAGGMAIIGILFNIIPIMRELIFFFYYSRVRVSDYFDIQADLLQMNAYNVENNETVDKEMRDSISKKQYKIADIFRRIANKIAISNKESEVKATKDLQNENKKYKIDDVTDTMPDSASSTLF